MNATITFKADTPYMEIPRCEDCRHWEFQSFDIGICARMGEPKNLMAISGTGRTALYTLRSFGCVQKEGR